MLLIWGTVVKGLMAVLAILATNTNVIPGYQGNQECNVSQDKDEDPW